MTDSYPLKWPDARERTEAYRRKDSNFDTTAAARDNLLNELRLMNASNIVISSNAHSVERRGGNILHLGEAKRNIEDPGVAVYYTWRNEQYALACDRWKTVTDNLQALNKTVNAIRGIERWGTGEMMKAAFVGFKALPEKATMPTCWEVLGIPAGSGKEMIAAAYRQKAKMEHPDMGGTNTRMQLLTDAYNIALSS